MVKVIKSGTHHVNSSLLMYMLWSSNFCFAFVFGCGNANEVLKKGKIKIT